MAITGPDTSFIACAVASLGVFPCSMWCITASTTTIASSTTIPMASTRPRSESVLTENPRRGKAMKVPIRDTGTVSSGMRVARQFWRNTNTTRITSTSASTSVCTISLTPSLMAAVVSRVISYFIPGGNPGARSTMVLRTAFCTSRALDPGVW